jgi:hypothetical protein
MNTKIEFRTLPTNTPGMEVMLAVETDDCGTVVRTVATDLAWIRQVEAGGEVSYVVLIPGQFREVYSSHEVANEQAQAAIHALGLVPALVKPHAFLLCSGQGEMEFEILGVHLGTRSSAEDAATTMAGNTGLGVYVEETKLV